MVNQLTFTRFIAAFFIVFFHYGRELVSSSTWENLALTHLNLGVSYFYVLSGFVMILAYGHKNHIQPANYYINRFARIYPLHLTATLLTIAVTILISINYLANYKFNFSTLFLHLLLIQAWIPESSLSLNVPAWSISVEMFFYFLFPFLYNYFIRKVSFKKLFIIIFIFWMICQLIMNWFFMSLHYGGNESLDRYFLKYNPALHLNSFLIGIVFGVFYRNFKEKLNGNYNLWIILLFFISWILIWFAPGLFYHNGLLAPIFGLIILLLTLNKNGLTKIFNHSKLIYLGEISFAIYLLQYPVFKFLDKVCTIIDFNKPYPKFLIGFGILLLVSHLSYKLIESPMRDKIKNIKLKR